LLLWVEFRLYLAAVLGAAAALLVNNPILH